MRRLPIEPRNLGKAEFSMFGAVAGLLGVLWFLGEQGSVLAASSAAQTFHVPVGGGWAFVLLTLAVIGLNALFVASETAVDLLTSLHVKHASEKATAKLQELLGGQQKYVAATSIGSQMARLALIFIGLLLAQDLAVPLFGIDPSVPAPQLSYGMILTAAACIAVPVLLVNLILGELVPKSFATLHPGAVAHRLYSFIRVTSLLFSIPAGVVVSVANILAARFGGKASFTMANQAEEQIKNLVETAQESGEIESGEKELLHSVFEFTDTVVREVMTPRVDIEAVPVGSDARDVAKMVEETGHSRIPLYEDTDDQIVGVIHAKDLLLAMVEGSPVDLRLLMRPPLFIPENMNLHEAMTQMRVHRSQLAIVQDEFGGTAGIATIEDIVEELVGDIVDEYDEEEQAVVATDVGFLVEGKTHLDDVNAAIGSSFESEEFDTIGGYVFGIFGRQPKVDESIVQDGFRFTVADTDGRRIEKLLVEALPNGEE